MTNSENSGYLETDAYGRLIIPKKCWPVTASNRRPDTFQSESEQRAAAVARGWRSCTSNRPTSATWTAGPASATSGRSRWGGCRRRLFQNYRGIKNRFAAAEIFFGGFGEPLFHPDILDMVRRAKALGGEVEMISNATLLTKEISQELVKLGLNMLWVSLDGATPESYTDIRLGRRCRRCWRTWTIPGSPVRQRKLRRPSLCAGFHHPAGHRIRGDETEYQRFTGRAGTGRTVRRGRFIVTNVLPYTKDMVDEVLYYRAINNGSYRNLRLPGMTSMKRPTPRYLKPSARCTAPSRD